MCNRPGTAEPPPRLRTICSRPSRVSRLRSNSLRYSPYRSPIDKLLVPQEGFRPPTPSLRSASSAGLGGVMLLTPLRWSATPYAIGSRVSRAEIMDLAEFFWMGAHRGEA